MDTLQCAGVAFTTLILQRIHYVNIVVVYYPYIVVVYYPYSVTEFSPNRNIGKFVIGQ